MVAPVTPAVPGGSPVRAYLGLGSNMGDKRAMVAEAVDRLGSVAGISVAARSRDYRTPPWGDTDQDWFVNACVGIETTLPPLALLDACLAVESAMGRERIRRWGPRNIDIDLLDYDGLSIHGDRLILPHPLLLERAFVLLPLAEIAGDLHVSGRRIGDVASRVADTGLVAFEPAFEPEPFPSVPRNRSSSGPVNQREAPDGCGGQDLVRA